MIDMFCMVSPVWKITVNSICYFTFILNYLVRFDKRCYIILSSSVNSFHAVQKCKCIVTRIVVTVFKRTTGNYRIHND